MGTFVKISNSTEKEDENRRGTFVELSTGKEIARNPDPPGGSPVTVKKASAKTETTKKKAPKNDMAPVRKASVPVTTKASKNVKPAEKATRKTTQTDPASYGWDPMVEQDLRNRAAQGKPAEKTPMPVTGAYAQLQNQARQAAVDLDTEALARANNAMKAMRANAGKQTVGDRVSDTASAVFSGSAGSLANLAGFAVNAYNDPAYYRRQIARMQTALAAGKTDDGLPLNDAKRRAVQQAIARMEAEAAKWERPDSLTNRIYGKADALQDDSGRFQAQAKQGLGPTGSLLVDAGVSMGQSTLDNAVGAVTGTGLLPFTLRAFGGAAQESRRTGADVSQQLVYGSAQAAKEYVTEKLFGLTGPQRLTGGGSLDSLVADGIRNVTERLSKTPAGQKALGGVLTWLASGATEGLEEIIGSILESTLINPNFRQWDPDNRTAQQKFEDGLYETLVGAVSGLMGGVNNLATFQTRANGTDQGPSNGPETAPSPAPESGGDQNGRQETAGRLLDLMRQIQAQRDAEAARQTAQVAPQNTQAAPPPVTAPARTDTVQAPQNAVRTVNGVPVLLQHVRNLHAGMDHETSARAIDDSMRKEAGTDLLNIIRRVQAQREAGTGQEIQQTPEAGQKQRQTEVTRLVDLIRQVQAQRETAASSEMDRVLKDRARVEYEQMPPDTQQAVDRAYEQGTVGMDAQNRVFQVDPERHIDRRDSGSVGNRKINAFQFDHPELHRFYVDAAQGLLSDLAATQKGGQIESAPGVRSDGVTDSPYSRYWRTSRSTSPALAYLLDSEGMTYARIEKALNAIIQDMGQENYADAKRVELVLDDMLSNGYEDVEGRPIPGVPEYVEAKNRIAGNLSAERAEARETRTAEAYQAMEDLLTDEEADGRLKQSAPGMDGLGAADAGSVNSDYDRLQAQSSEFHPEGPNPARPVDVPKTDFDGRPISQTASTVMGARAIPDDVIPMIEQMVADGALSYTRVSDAAALERARSKIAADGFDAALAEYRQAVDRGIASKDLSVLGQLLLAEAANSRNGNITAEILLLNQASGTNVAQAQQARSIFRKLSPESQLYGIQRAVGKINAEAAGKKTKPVHGVRDTDAVAAYSAVNEAYKEAYQNVVDTMHRAFEDEANTEQHPNTPGWVQKLGQDLAKNAQNRAGLGGKKQGPSFYSTLLNDLTSLMNEHVPKRTGEGTKRTAADKIADLFANRAEYARAWEQAKTELAERYKDNPDALDALDDFLNASMGYNGVGPDTTMMRAVAEAALENDVRLKELVIRGKYDADALVEQLSDTLIQRTNASGTDADIVRDAVRRYVQNRKEDASRTASDYLRSDIRRVMRDAGLKMSEIIQSRPGDRAAVLDQITTALTAEYGVSEQAAAEIADDIAEDFERAVRERSRARLESMFKDRPGRTRKTLEAKFEELINLGAFDGEFSQQAVKKLFGIQAEAQISPELIQKFLDQTDQQGRDKVMGEIAEDIARQIPVSFLERLHAFRYLGMLFNPPTHIRNSLCNVAFGVIQRRVKNLVGVGLERAFVHDRSQRTKSILTPADKGLRDFARSQYDADQKLAMGQKKYTEYGGSEIQRMIAEAKRPLGKLQPLGDLNTEALDMEDLVFNRDAYVDSLAQALKAKGVTAEEAASGQKADLVNQARDYAVLEAQKATFRDYNAFSEFISSLGRTGDRSNRFTKALSAAVDVRFPFRRTPANVMVRGVEYSPAGLIKAVSVDAAKVRNGEMSAAEMIDHLSAGMGGTAIFALGAFLAAQGLLTLRPGGDDKREDDFLKNMGFQDFALRIGGITFSLGWLGTTVMPLFAGAAMMEALNEEAGSGALVSFLQAMTGMTDSIMETSMLQSFKELLDGIGYADNKLWYIASSSIMDYLEQLVPTAVSKTASALDDTVRSSYVPAGTPEAIEDVAYFLQGIQRKIPILRNQLPPKIDLWGQEVSNGGKLERTLESFASPGFFSKIDLDSLETELQRLKDAAGSSSVLPAKVEKSFKVGDGTKYLTADEYTTYAKTVGKTRYEILSSLIQHPGYKKLSDADKAKTIEAVYSYATEVGKMQVSDYKPDSETTIELMNSPLDPATFFLYKRMASIESEKKQSGSQANANVRNAIKNDSSLSPKEKNLLDDWILSDITVLDKDLHVDYSNDETFAVSQMSESAQKHWDLVRDRTGISTSDYQTAWSICNRKGTKAEPYREQDKIRDLADQLGISPAEARRIYSAIKTDIDE